MKKINGFTITSLSMSGFKCFEETTSFNLGDTTFITASNGQGKSSIADAIAFAFVGTPFFGDRGLDRLHNRNTDEMTVSVDFVDDCGETHNLTRTRKRDNTTIAYDGINIRQSDLNSAFGDRDIFLSILNPLYFINVLGDSGKGLLEKILPAVKHEDVLAALSDSSRKILAGQSLLSPETFIKNRRVELKELEKTLISYQGQKELLDHQREERTANIDKLRADIDTVMVEMAELVEIRDNEFDRTAEESVAAELRKRRAELLSDATYSSTDKAMQNIMGEIRALEKSIAKQDGMQYKSSFTKQIAEAEAGFKVLFDEHAKIKTTLPNTAVGYKCPTCAVVITTENIEVIKADLQQRLAELINDGKKAKSGLMETKLQDEKAKREFEENKTTVLAAQRDKLAVLNQQLQEINVARELDAEDYGERLTSVDNQITEQEHRLANGNWTPEQALQFAELEQSKKEYETKIATLNSVIGYDYATLIADIEVEISRLKRLINEVIQYMAKRIELMLGGLKMSNNEIVLTEIIKTTGEVKDCFRFSYDGRDYKCLSLSEKIRAGLDVSALIGRLSGRNYPVFIDNGESICSFGNVDLTGQILLTRVVRSHELQVTCKNREQSRAAA